MKVLIIGSGWYGCHLASVLITSGIDTHIIDKTNGFFNGSSFKNQNRLHLGYHYPRSNSTIIECKKGYEQFIKKYGQLIMSLPNNLYFIASENSILDIETYKNNLILSQLELCPYTETLPIPIINIENPVFQVKEQYIDPHAAKEYFTELLSDRLIRIHDQTIFSSIDSIVEATGNTYDLIINCTYNMLKPITYEHYELFITLLYRIDTDEPFAYTVMDGPFFSIYPYDIDNKIYTVTSVIHGVIYKGKEANYVATSEDIDRVREKMCSQILQYIPEWDTVASYTGYYTSWKTKHDFVSDDRSMRYERDGSILSIYGGKITGIFEAERLVKEMLGIN